MRSPIISCLLLVMGAMVALAASPVREITFTHPRGWSIVNMPINPVQDAIGDVFTEDDLARVSGADMVVSPYGSNHWRVYLPGIGMLARPIEGGSAYLLLFKRSAGSFTLRGIPWGKDSLSVGLVQGLNLVGMPRGVPAGFTLQSLTTMLGARALYWIDESGKWKTFIHGWKGPDSEIGERDGFIVLSPTARIVAMPDALPQEKVLYVSYKGEDSAVWSMDTGGGNKRQLTSGCFASATIIGPDEGWFSYSSIRTFASDTAPCGDGFGYYTQNFATGESRATLPYTTGLAIEVATQIPDDSGVIMENDPFPGLGQTLLYLFRYGTSAPVRLAEGNRDIIQGACSVADYTDGQVAFYNALDANGFWLYSQRLGSSERTVVSSPGENPGFAMLAPWVSPCGRYIYSTRFQLVAGRNSFVFGTGDIYRRRVGSMGEWELVFSEANSDENVSAFSRDGDVLFAITTTRDAGTGGNVMSYNLKTRERKFLTTGNDGNTLVRTKDEVSPPSTNPFVRFRSRLSVR